MSGSQFLNLKAAGLSTLSNPLSAVQDGSLAESINVNIDRNQVIEPRRGFAQYGDLFGDGTDRTKQLFNYKDVIIRHVLNKMQFDSDLQGSFEDFSGPAITEIETGLRIKGIEANGNFYFVSSTGIRKISARSSADFPFVAVTAAGGVKALDIAGKTNYSSSGFLEANSKVAYRQVWGRRDLNENLILGSPSSRTVVFNVSATNSCIVDLTFAVPNEVTDTSYFYQVYRTGVFSGDLPPDVAVAQEPADPGDEMYLVFEDVVTSAQITAGIISVSDITPEEFRKNGTLLYSNPTSGEGIEQANEKPPFAKDIALYKNYTFFSNTKTIQRMNLSFLSASGITSGDSTFTISDGVTSNVYTFRGTIETYTANFSAVAAATDFYNSASGTAKHFTLQSSNSERKYAVYFSQSVNDVAPSLAGHLNIKVAIQSADTIDQMLTKAVDAILLATNDFNITLATKVMTIKCANNGPVAATPSITIALATISKDDLGTGADAATNKIFLPRIPTGTENGPTTSQQLEQIATSLISIVNEKDTIVYAYYTSGFNDVPGQVLFEQQTTTGAQFFLTSNVGSQFNPTLPSTGTTVGSTNEVSPNRIFFSKPQQPEAVPLANYIDVGPKDREIKRIIALRDSLFIFKEDGIYRLSGDVAPFTIAPFDFSTQVLAADTAVVLNNQIYAMSTQGVCTVTDTGVSIISRPVENQLLKIGRQPYNYKTASFGVSYETDRSYCLFTVTEEKDTVATQVFRYNTFTNCWTKWSVSATAGIVNFADDKMYIGAGDLNSIEKERKTLTRIDHADREYTLQVALDGVDGSIIKLNDSGLVSPGDVLLQKQYLTGEQFDRMLDKLDRDVGVNDKDYVLTLGYKAGKSLRSSLTALATKLDNDAKVIYTGFSADIGDFTQTITSIAADGANAVITVSTPHTIKVGRYINISGSNCSPVLDGIKEVLAVTSTTITVQGLIVTAGTAGFLQTAVDDFRDIQSCYNIISEALNLDASAFYTNYPKSTGTVEFETVALSVDKNRNAVTVNANVLMLFGNVTLYKSIPSTVTWNPIYFQDPSMTKQIREGTMIFENSNFSKVTISYATDLSPSFVPVIFEGAGLSVGDWGFFNFGAVNWGGVAAPIPLRTYIPLEKQRCRYMNVRFTHKVAFEKYAIYGLSLTWRPVSARGYR